MNASNSPNTQKYRKTEALLNFTLTNIWKKLWYVTGLLNVCMSTMMVVWQQWWWCKRWWGWCKRWCQRWWRWCKGWLTQCVDVHRPHFLASTNYSSSTTDPAERIMMMTLMMMMMRRRIRMIWNLWRFTILCVAFWILCRVLSENPR